MAAIPLTQGQVTTVDDSDVALLNKYKWYAGGTKGGYYYAATNYKDENGKTKRLYLHRFLMNPPAGMVVDHIDGNTLNNLRSNLRVCTYNQNIAAQLKKRTKKHQSKYRGVIYIPKAKRHWQAYARQYGEQIYIGVFDTEQEAAEARDRVVKELWGEFAVLNFPVTTGAN